MTNAFAITGFDSSPTNQTVAFEVAWAEGLFDHTLSRRLDLFTSTNLLDASWALVGGYPMPPGATTSHVFEVSQTNVLASAAQPFLDTFGGIGFYRLGLDLDSDGDGLSDAFESLVSFTDPALPDTDYDGLSDGDELRLGTVPNSRDSDEDGLVDGSDPDPLVKTPYADCDCDWIRDAYEAHWFGSTNAVDSLDFRDATGFALGWKIAAGMNPTNAASDLRIAVTNELASWKLWDGFEADSDLGCGTSLVYERTFPIDRASPWQAFFLSASPTNAAPWSVEGATLEWDDGLWGGTCTDSPPGDSLCLSPSYADAGTLTVRLRAGGGRVRSPTPLYLVSYAPRLALGCCGETRLASGMAVWTFADGVGAEAPVSLDRSLRPNNGPLSEEECWPDDLEGIDAATDGALAYTNGCVRIGRNGVFALPNPGASASLAADPSSGGYTVLSVAPRLSYGDGHGAGGVAYDAGSGEYTAADPYPLDTPCLRDGWRRGAGGAWNCSCSQSFDLGLGGAMPEWLTTNVIANGDVCTATLSVGGTAVWEGAAYHSRDGGGLDEPDILSAADDCGGCGDGCADGNCDSLEGHGLGSVRFRIPLGSPRRGQVSGFAWFSSDGPVAVSPSLFQVLARGDASVTESMSGGTRTVRCNDAHGREVAIAPVPGGVRITVNDAATGALEHRWEVVNVGGSESAVRFRKTSRLDNVMDDWTYTYADGAWSRHDNISGLAEEVESCDSLNANGVKWVRRTTRDAGGNVLAAEYVESRLVGAGRDAVLRETYREERTGRTNRWSAAEYWDAPGEQKHGKLRLLAGNDRPWEYHDYDDAGRETLRLEQYGGSPVPSDFPTVAPDGLLCPDYPSDVTATTFGYGLLPGDGGDSADFARPRVETRYAPLGADAVASRTWRRYTHVVASGFPAVKVETWRAASQANAYSAAGNAYSYVVAFDEDAEGVPLVLRGEVAEALDEDGTLTQNTYSFGNGVVSCTSRKSYMSHQRPIATVTERDAQFGRLLAERSVHLASGIAFAERRHLYDDKGRLRSTTYQDGTCETNAYSCCRLLWRRGRDGRTVLRSAQTGTDHLYYAEEEVWLGEMGNGEWGTGNGTGNGFRVTQHFCDALGRETNAVVYAGTVPGEAATPTGGPSLCVAETTTAYPYGGSDYAVSTDARGVTTTTGTSYFDGGTVTAETVSTGGVAVVTTTTTCVHGGGTTTRREWQGGAQSLANEWTEESRFDEYDLYGFRFAHSVTAASGCGGVLSISSTYDNLGRLVQSSRPGAVTYNFYDGGTSRLLSSMEAVGEVERTTHCIYDEFGEMVGTERDGVTNRTDVSYLVVSGALWRVETATVCGAGECRASETRERLSGFEPGMRSETVAVDEYGTETRTVVMFDGETGIETTTTTSPVSGQSVGRTKFSLPLDEEFCGVVSSNAYDALGRVVATWRGTGAMRPSQAFVYSPAGDLLETHTFTNETATLVETCAYDAFGRAVSRVNALGEETSVGYDPVGNETSVEGATYPARMEYDGLGRRKSLTTFRDAGEPDSGDTTTWTLDDATGLCTEKTYADESQFFYSYTPDGLLETAETPEGRFRTNWYNDRRELVMVEWDAGDTLYFDYDAYSREVSASNDVSSVVYARDGHGNVTGETQTVSSEGPSVIAAISRTFDAFGRLASCNGAALSYDDCGRLATISNENAVVTYQYSADGYDLGYAIALSNGVTFTRSLARDEWRRSLVTGITNSVNGVAIDGLAYSYDALGRPVSRNADTFGYNERGEVTEATIAGQGEHHAYDDIGNSLWAAYNAETNAYESNSRNQYSAISTSGENVAVSYDLDGNMTQHGVWTHSYDVAGRLATVESNGIAVAAFAYDARGRRVRKEAADGTHLYFYDGWLLIHEQIFRPDNTTNEIDYVWGKDISGSRDGVAGIGGLLYIAISGSNSLHQLYVPFYDAYGNILGYCDAQGNIVANYTYDAFGNTISQSGPLADTFAFRFSTKYFDHETVLYYYGYRYYKPGITRWLTEDPIDVAGGVNFYCFCENSPIVAHDAQGLFTIYIHTDGAGHVGISNKAGTTFDYGRYHGKYKTGFWGKFDQSGPNILIKDNGLNGSHSYTRFHFTVCPRVDDKVTQVLNEKFESGLKYLPEEVIAKYDKKPGPLSDKMRYMGSDWTINNNCMTFTFGVVASAAGRVGKEKDCTQAERRQAMAMAALAYLSCWHVSPSHIKASLHSFAQKNNWITEE